MNRNDDRDIYRSGANGIGSSSGEQGSSEGEERFGRRGEYGQGYGQRSSEYGGSGRQGGYGQGGGYGQQGGSFGRDYRDYQYGRDYGIGRDYGRDFGGRDYAREYGGRDYGRDYGRTDWGERGDYGYGYGRGYERGWGRDIGGGLGRDRGEEGWYGRDRDRGWFNRDWERPGFRGRDEERDFWGRQRHERHEGRQEGEGRGIGERISDFFRGDDRDRDRERYESQQWGRYRQDEPNLWDRVKGAFTGRGPKGYTRSDDRIREDVCERLTYHPYVDASEIDVLVANGEVTLSGFVEDRSSKRLAEDIVEDIRGVRDVHNQIRVKSQTQGIGNIGSTQTSGTTAGVGGVSSSSVGTTGGNKR